MMGEILVALIRHVHFRRGIVLRACVEKEWMILLAKTVRSSEKHDMLRGALMRVIVVC
jgi:hypothetical protein